MTRQRLVGYLWFFRQTPMKFQFWLNGEKINPPACLRALARKLCITWIADFGPNVSCFFLAHFFSSYEHINMKLSGINRQCKGNNWAKNSSQLPSITPFFGYKHPLGGQKFLVAIFVERQIKLRREWFFSWCFFDDPIACKSLHNKSIKRNRHPAQGRVAADVETQWHQRIWHRDILGHWENIMFVILPNLRVFIFIHEKWNGHLVKGSQYWTFWSNDFLHSDQIWVMGILSTEGENISKMLVLKIKFSWLS